MQLSLKPAKQWGRVCSPQQQCLLGAAGVGMQAQRGGTAHSIQQTCLVPTPGYNCALFLLNRIAILQTPVCLEPGTEYSVDVYFSQPSDSDPKAKSFILIDSVSSSVTIPLRLYLYHCSFFFYTLTQNILK